MSDKQIAGVDAPAAQPRVDVFEDATGITIVADLPGASTDTLELKVEGRNLLLEAAVATALPGDLESVYAEVRVPRYRHAFELSRELDTERIDAALKDGVLRLRIPKVAQAQPRRIAIQQG
ncbi:Hsp20/alpha crystallin family protein [Chitinimonas sp.]|uniref:Hsp20/alpha crystallin family protein n=1 Tax=Chitinimonas sp. TaxID=1934313 RepID=UPI002F91E6F6